jgi:hypothetical protein
VQRHGLRLGCTGAVHLGSGLLLASSAAVFAETTVGQWSSIASTTNVACGDGLRGDVVEVPGTLRLTIFLNGRRASEVRISLAADGSGKTETSGIAGRVIYEVAAGTGKRPIRAAQVEGICQWLWKPN